MKYTFPILFVLLLFNTSCYKHSKGDISDPVELPSYTFTINADAKQYFNFKNGSWWLYKDNVSGKKDCLYVTDYRFYYNYSKGNFRNTYTFLRKETTNIYLKLQTPDTAIIYTTEIYGDINFSKINTDFFANNIIKDSESAFVLDTAKFKIIYYDNQIVDSLQYSNCVLFNTKPSSEDSLYLLVSKNIGIVKYAHKYKTKIIRDISLLKYHIIQ